MILAGSKIGLEYTENKIHCLILLSISLSIGMHLLSVGQAIAFDKINEQFGGSTKPKLIIFRLIPFIIIPLMTLKFGVIFKEPNIWYHSLLFMIFPLILVIPKKVLSNIKPSNFAYYEENHFNYFKTYYSIVFSILIIVGTLGAINLALIK